MRRPWPAWLVGMTLLGVSAALPASAEDVPLPRPTPFGRSVEPPPAHRPATVTAANQAAPVRSTAGSDAVAQPLAVTGVTPVPPPSKLPAVAVGPGGTFDPKQRVLIDRVNTYLSGVQTLVGDFVQVAPDGSRSEGKFYMQKPGRIRFEYNPPSPIEIVADGSSLVVRDRNLATQDVYPLSQTPLRFLLSDRIDLMRDTNVVSVTADDVFVSVTIEEKQALVGTSRLMLMVGAKDGQLKQWTVTDPQGYDTTVAVYNLDSTKRVDPSLFKIDFTKYPTSPG